jgi:serine/threonine protein kinase
MNDPYPLYFLAPELLRGQTGVSGPAMDVYALGVILYTATVGRRPIDGEGLDLVVAIRDASPPRPSEIVPGYPPALEAVVMRAIARDPAQRYATGEELAAALDSYLDGAGLAPGPDDLGSVVRSLLADR